MSHVPTPPGGRSITRHDLEAIIRRAAELSLADADPSDAISEDELVRIGNELGLPAHHVKQALYERPSLDADDAWYARWFGPAAVVQTRTVPGSAAALQARLEEYFARQEYLTVVRRRPNELVLEPAADAISRVARAFSRPGRRFGLAHAQRVVVAVNALPDGKAHVRVESDHSKQRSDGVSGGMILGGTLGAMCAAGLSALAIVSTSGPLEAVLVGGNIVASVGAGLAIAVKAEAKSFRDRIHRVKVEIAHLLDRAETGQALEPPPAPWRRNLEAKLFGPRR